MRWPLLLPLIAFVGLGAGCGLPPDVVVIVPDDGGKIGQAVVSNARGSWTLRKPFAAVALNQSAVPGQPFTAERQDIQKTFGRTLTATPRAPVAYDIAFVTAQELLAPQAALILAEIVKTAKSWPTAQIAVIGHAGLPAETARPGIALRRAQLVRQALVDAGVPSEAIEVSGDPGNEPGIPPTPPSPSAGSAEPTAALPIPDAPPAPAPPADAGDAPELSRVEVVLR